MLRTCTRSLSTLVVRQGKRVWRVSGGNPRPATSALGGVGIEGHGPTPSRVVDATPTSPEPSQTPASPVAAATAAASRALSFLLPAGYPASVGASYGRYCIHTALASAFASCNGVLATQAMLSAVGLGAGALPLAAGVNWVLKDGLGQLGGVLFARCVIDVHVHD
jgi:hypothetical protein